jgi:hypothetical protein
MQANSMFQDLLRSDFHKKFMVSPVHDSYLRILLIMHSRNTCGSFKAQSGFIESLLINPNTIFLILTFFGRAGCLVVCQYIFPARFLIVAFAD